MGPLLVRSLPPHRKTSDKNKKDGRTLRVEHLEPRLVLSTSSLLQQLAATSGSAFALNSTADSYISSSRSTTNYGKTSDLLVQNWSGSSESYLKYDLSGVSGIVTKAVLNLRMLARSMNKSSLVISVQLLADAKDGWIEGTGGTNRKSNGAITWANSADGSGTILTFTFTANQLRKSSTLSLDVTTLINQSINANNTASFVISAVSSAGKRCILDFASRNHRVAAYRPTLSLTTVTGATPTVVEQPTVSNQTSTSASLSVLGNDVESGEAGLTYRWSVTAPSGGTATFSSNGTNAAKDTTVTFTKAGTYVFTAKITDADGNYVNTSSVSVTVAQSLSSISLSPSTVTLAKSGTQQFTASGKDQFGNSMSLAAGSVTWSASVGSFSSGTSTNTVTYVAPAAATTGTVTATQGSFSATAAITVVASNYLGLLDAALANLTQSLVADGSISRLDMISIFNTIADESDGIVDSADLADLRTILSNSTTLCMANYVVVLTNDVVNGNSANAKYLGTTLGNLAAGNANSKLDKLVSKWFYGTDLPSTGGYSYDATTAGTLFGSTAASHFDELQGALGDCYFIAAMGSIADKSQTAIANMFVDNGDGTWTVRFYYNGTADYVTVNRQLPVTSYGYLIFQGYGTISTNSNNELWLPLLEKAYAQWNETGKTGQGNTLNSYAGIEGGWMGEVYEQALGYNASDYAFITTSQQTLINALASGYSVTLGTNSYPASTTGLYGGHAYNILSYSSSTGKFSLYNPWGSNQPNQLTWTQLTQNCDWFTTINPSGSVPISSVSSAILHSVAMPLASASLASSSESAILSTAGSRTITLSAESEKSAQTMSAASVDAMFEERGIARVDRSQLAINSISGLETELFHARVAFDSADDSVFDNLDAAMQLTDLLLSDAV